MRTILIVDDDREVRRVLCTILSHEGYAVAEAEDGRQALRIHKDVASDLILIDILMPEMDGLETIGALRRSSNSVKIAALSGGGRLGPEKYLELAKKMGADRTLTKPFRSAEVVALVRELLGEADTHGPREES